MTFEWPHELFLAILLSLQYRTLPGYLNKLSLARSLAPPAAQTSALLTVGEVTWSRRLRPLALSLCSLFCTW